MRKRIRVFTDGRQALISGDFDFTFNKREVAEEYEVEMKDDDFEKMMEHPDKVKVDKIKNKRRIEPSDRARMR